MLTDFTGFYGCRTDNNADCVTVRAIHWFSFCKELVAFVSHVASNNYLCLHETL